MPHRNTAAGGTKSRSPLPPSNYKISLSPRPFLPPSHYAAAAGISYVRRSPSNGQEYSDSNDRAKSSTDNGENSGEDYTSVFMPVGYPSDAESASNSSIEFNVSATRRSPGKEKQSSSRRGRRQSLINDLPQLEANLLPSLRDTINRMTRPPSRTGLSASSESASHLGVPKPVRSSRSLSPSGTSESNPKTSHFDEYPTFEPSTPQPSSSSDSIPAKTAEILMPRTNQPPKPPLKSALRPPTPKMFTKACNDYPTGTSTKSVRSILKQAAIATSTANQTSTANAAGPPPRSRSRADTGSKPMVSFEEQHIAPPPRPPHKIPSESREPDRPQASNIPRLQGKRFGARPQCSTDESESEDQYDAGRRKHRQLVVTNAEVFPSSSESDIEWRDRERARGRTSVEHRKDRRNSRGDTQGVGLGIDFDSGSKKNRPGSVSRKETTNPSHREPSVRSTRRTEDPQTSSSTSRSSEYHSAKDSKANRNPVDTLDVSREHQRRRTALLGIVSRLDIERHPTAVEEDSENDHHGEEGFDTSGSFDYPEPGRNSNAISQQLREDDSHYESEDQAAQPSPHTRRDRPRSSSRTPTSTYLSSTDNDEQLTRAQSSYTRATLHPERYLGPSHPNSSRQRKASRSPVVPQADTSTFPAALRRHSVYHRPPSPDPPNEAVEKRTNDKRLSGTNPNLRKQQRDSSVQIRESGDRSSQPHAAAARERKAYGIPPSNSDEEYPGFSRRMLPHVDSDLSSVGSMYWDDDTESELSPAAETLFRKLGGSQAKGDRKSYQSSEEKASRSGAGSSAQSPANAVQKKDERHQSRLPSPSPRREERRTRFQLPSPPPAHVDDSNDRLNDMETRRQKVIIEIYEAEAAFVKRMQVFVQLFVLPLRVQNSKDWISGVPSEVARLFDWLEDIVVLHTQILSALESIRATQRPIVERIAESIRVYIPRLEVYQPYLVKLVDVMALIDQLMKDDQSDFGEYVRLQEAAPESEGWNFQDFLVEPVNVLAKFPEFLSRLLDLTPKGHRDYLSTFALVHSTDMFIRVMTEVKVREDEYDMIQRFAARIQGLAPSSQLATRERRLLHQGILHLTDVEETTSNDLSATTGTSKISRYFPTGMARSGGNSANWTAKPMAAISERDTGGGRSGSTNSSSTLSSLRTASSGSSSSASSIFFSSFRIPIPQGRLNKARLPSLKAPDSPSPAPCSSNTPFVGTPVQVFVFTDLMLLAAPTSTTEPDGWTLLRHIGTVRILGVYFREQDSHDPETITVEALPVDALKLNQTTNVDEGSVYLFRFLVPKDASVDPSDDASSASVPDDEGPRRSQWLLSLRRCQKFTTCSLAIPSKQHDPQLDVAFDKHQAVFSLLASGLPLPKSPSMQMADMLGGDAEDATTQERQERGWWSLRFQQVFREIQRQDMALASTVLDV
ncbi:hypothetical protein D9615_008234 [Tricholomella constricta]|uniref:DH domain-containing protein n=1 Tax=Tricholomella constricta TaxID=117010 RepID=A0A8H5M025_9AGAR|nr:hypothetical protein D9615_008234 [Tricholomella constricta]